MKKVMTFIGSTLIFSFLLTSCGGESVQKEAESKLKGKDSIVKPDTNNIVEPQVTVPTIKIGQEEWMTEDINVTSYNNGDPISEAKSEMQWKDYSNKKLGCYRKLNNGTYVYNGFAVVDKRGIVPIGFAIPTYNQFNKLITFLGGGDSQSGKATKSLATYLIYIEDWVGDQETGGLEEVEIKTNGNSGFKAKKAMNSASEITDEAEDCENE